MKIRVIIPNLFTAANLFCGLLALYFIFQPFHYIDYAFYAILAAAFFDLIDGMAARLLKGQSEFGKQFDSLSDVVSFGVAPALLAFDVLNAWTPIKEPLDISSIIIFAAPALFAIAAGMRLAIFNTDSRQSNSFRGLPSPAAALLLSSFCLYWSGFFGDEHAVTSIIIASLVIAASMLIPFPLIALKLKSRDSKTLAIVMVLISLVLFRLFTWASFTLIILVYLAASPVIQYFSRIFASEGSAGDTHKQP